MVQSLNTGLLEKVQVTDNRSQWVIIDTSHAQAFFMSQTL